MKFFQKIAQFTTLIILFELFMVENYFLFAQINAEQQDLIRQYTQQIKEYKTNNQLKMAAYYSNKCASIYLGAGNYQDAIDSYLESAQINDQIGNDLDNKKIFNNVAMLYTEMNQLKNSLKYFEKSLLISRRQNNKSEIAVSLMDISTILSFNKQYDKAIEYLEEALKLSNDLDEVQNLRTCYNLLSQCHKASGNSKKADEYYNYYLAYDKKIREGKEIPENIKKNFLAAESNNLHIYEDKKGENDTQLNKPTILNSSIDSSLFVMQSFKEKDIDHQIEVLNIDKTLNESKLKIANANNEKNKMLIYIGAILLIVLILLLAIGIYLIQRKQKYIRELEQKLFDLEKVKN